MDFTVLWIVLGTLGGFYFGVILMALLNICEK